MGGDDLSNYTVTAQGTTTANIAKKALTVSGITASNKTYDGNTSATVSVENAAFAGLVSGDTVSVTATGTFADKTTGNGKTVNLSETMGGGDVGNYTVTAQGTTTANIAKKALTVSGITASNKQYDGNTSATVSKDNAVLTGLVSGDSVSVTAATGTFSDKAVANGKTVNLVETMGGGDVGNYTVTAQGTTTANITKKQVTVSGITVDNKNYDGNVSATVNGGVVNDLVAGEEVTVSATGTFINKNAGQDKTVNLVETLGGAHLGNYEVTKQFTTTATIHQIPLTISGITASTKVYDQTRFATVSVAGAVFTGKFTNDDVSVTATGAFGDKTVGDNKTVTLTETVAGADAGNYSITKQFTTTASITKKALTVSGITVSDKVYDRTTAATVSVANASFEGLINGDAVTVAATGSFRDKVAEADKTIDLTETMGGADVENYEVTAQGTATATIFKKPSTIDGITAANKEYDSTDSVTLNTDSQNISNIIAGDDVSATVTGTFDSEHAADNIIVSLVWTVAGGDKDNYEYDLQETTVADITKRVLSIDNIISLDKIYDGTANAVLNTGDMELAGLIPGDDIQVSVSGLYPSHNAGIGKTVNLTINVQGTDVGNYDIDRQQTTISSIISGSTLFRLFTSC